MHQHPKDQEGDRGSMRPVIGISASISEGQQPLQTRLGYSYVRSINEHGGLGVVLPVVVEEELMHNSIRGIDGLLLSGGGDVDPSHYGEPPRRELGRVEPRRDLFELAMARMALERGLPVLAICRGIQVLNVAAGGTLYQDLAAQVEGAIKHSQDAPRWALTHRVELQEKSRLHRVFGRVAIGVNSFHHQAVRDVAPGFATTARATGDGVVEAVEHDRLPFVIGVQFHPENLWGEHPAFRQLFAAFVQAAGGEGRSAR